MVKQFILLLIIFNLLNAIPCKPTIEASNSITRDLIVELPGNEKINKRSVDDAMESEEDDDNSDNFTSLNDDESGDSQELSYESSENYNPSVSTFATDQQVPLRLKRFLSQALGNVGIGQRFVRSIDITNNENGDGMETAENGLVFRPLFRTKNNFAPRVARSIKESDNAESMDEMETAENGMVFRPLFRTKSSRVRRNIDNSKTDQYVDDMETAANGLVFRPVFRTNNRLALGQRSRRSVNYDLGISPSAVNVVNSNDLHSRRNLRINRSTKERESLSEKNNVNDDPKNMAFRS